MHPAIQALADRYNIKISNRVCGGHGLNEPAYNGKDIASRYLLVKYDETMDEDYPISSSAHHFSDHDLLHETGHWVAAKEEQKDLP